MVEHYWHNQARKESHQNGNIKDNNLFTQVVQEFQEEVNEKAN